MATPDYGLIGGLGEGLKQGLLAYSKQKQLKRENQIQDLTAGVTTDENGDVQAGPGLLAKQQAQQAEYQRQQAAATPGSKSAQDYAAAIKGAGVTIPNAGDLSEEQIQKAQSVYEAQMNREAALARAQAGNQFKQERVSQGDERIHNQNLSKVNNDPTATQLVNTTNNLKNAVANYQKGGATPQEFQELQQAVRSNLGLKGTSGVDERASTYLDSLGIRADKITQFLTGDPKSVMESDPKFGDQITKLANLEIENKKGQYRDQVGKLTAGHKSFYNNHPDLKDDFEAAVGAGNVQMGVAPQGLVQPQTASPQQGLISPTGAAPAKPMSFEEFMKSRGPNG